MRSAVATRFRAGWFSDPEDFHGTYRMTLALGILRAAGVEPEWEHSDHTGTIGTGLMQRNGHVCDYRCRPAWPAWATDETFDRAYALADTIQTERGHWHKAQAADARLRRAEAQRKVTP